MSSLKVDASSLAGLDLPFYIRKLNKRSDWGDPSDALERRVDYAIDSAFRSEKNMFSFYRVRNDAELAIVIVALNAHRARLTSTLDFIAVTEMELQDAQIKILENPGETSCDLANLLHVDVKPSTDRSIRELCQSAMSLNRSSARISKPQAKNFVEWASSYYCHAMEGVSKCKLCGLGDRNQPLDYSG